MVPPDSTSPGGAMDLSYSRFSCQLLGTLSNAHRLCLNGEYGKDRHNFPNLQMQTANTHGWDRTPHQEIVVPVAIVYTA